MADEEVALPGGAKVSKNVLIAAVALTVGIVGYAWWKARSGEASSGPQVLTVDPNDAFPSTDRVPTGGSDNAGPDQGDDPIDTDSEWTQAGVEYMSRNGWEPAVVQIALGNYLARQKLKAGPPNQADIVRAVKGAFGAPPVAGDLPIQMEDLTTTPPGGGGETGGSLGAVKNLRVTGTTRDSVSLAWDAVSGATRYMISAEGISGVSDAIFDYTTDTKYTSTERPRGTKITFFVMAERGDENGPEARIEATTKS